MDLGLESAGFSIKWQAETDPLCCKVLEKHWPHVENLGDVHQVQWEGVGKVDLVCGGFPCQPVSIARGSKSQGTEDARWLWPEFFRCIRTLQPQVVLVENVPGLLTALQGSAAQEVFGDLAALGYDAEWDCIPSAMLGSPHIRYRLFIVASRRGRMVADTDSQTRLPPGATPKRIFTREGQELRGRSSYPRGYWAFEPNMGRVAYGVPSRVDRLRAIGNAVVPQVAEWIGKRILAIHFSGQP